MGSGVTQLGDSVFADAAVGEDFKGGEEAAEFGDAGAGARVEITALDSHLSAHDEDSGDSPGEILHL